MSIFDFFSLLGGVGLFLFGMTMMSTGLRNACGDNLRGILEKATANKFLAIIVGVAVTILIQSSSATDVMVIGFVNSAMMTLEQAIGVIMGANIGTTITAQITAFDLSTITPLVLFIGVVLYVFVKKSFVKYIGSIIMGFGMLFLGISLIKAEIKPLADAPWFVHIIDTLSNPALAILFGIVFTALLQSSSSSTVIFQSFAVENILSYDTAVYLIIGAAIGSTAPNLLASLTANRNGKRSAYINLIFNILRAVIIIILINIFHITKIIQDISPSDVGRQIANTHTFFAIVAVIILAPASKLIIKITEKIIPILPEETEKMADRELKFMTLNQNLPSPIALHQAQMEIARMGKLATKNLRQAIECFFDPTEAKVQKVLDREESVDILTEKIDAGVVRLRSLGLTALEIEKVSKMTIAVNDIERISDYAENIVEYVDMLKSRKAELSEKAVEELKEMAEVTIKSVEFSVDIFEKDDFSSIPALYVIEEQVDNFKADLIANHVDRLMVSSCDPVAGVVFTDMVTDLERCSDHACNIACALQVRPKLK
ncbi:MAG: Na/Pi cotransporter family protein [Firmicutes bacterium]|nr:Na/Pi cotransporter family protein [Bacillota bacterium]